MSFRDLFSRKAKTEAPADPYGLPSHADVSTEVHRSSVRYDQLMNDDDHTASSSSSHHPAEAQALSAGAPSHTQDGHVVMAIPVDASPAFADFGAAQSSTLLTNVAATSTPDALPPRLSADTTRAMNVPRPGANSVASSRSGLDSAPGSFVSASSVPKRLSSRAQPQNSDSAGGAATDDGDDALPSHGIRVAISSGDPTKLAPTEAELSRLPPVAEAIPDGALGSRASRRKLRPYKRVNNVNFVIFFALLLGFLVAMVVSSAALYVAIVGAIMCVLNGGAVAAFYCQIPIPPDEPDEEQEEEEDAGLHSRRQSNAQGLLAGASGGAADDGGALGADVAMTRRSVASPTTSNDSKSPVAAAAAAAAAAGTPAEAAAPPSAADDLDDTASIDSTLSGAAGLGGMGAIHLVRRDALAERERLRQLKRLDRKARKRVHKSLIFYVTFSLLVCLLCLGRHFIFH